MINYLQLNKNKEQIVITEKVWNSLLELLVCEEKNYSEKLVDEKISSIENGYNINIKNIVKEFLNYIIRNHAKYIQKNTWTYVISDACYDINMHYYKIFYSSPRKVLLLAP